MSEPGPTYQIANRPMPDYLRCQRCGRQLAPVVERGGKTAIELHRPDGILLIRQAEFTCDCGAKKNFRSESMAAVRLGLVEA